MKLVIRRDQRPAVIGLKPVFVLDVRAEISDDEKANVKKYRLGDTILYERKPLAQGSNEYAQLGHTLAWRFMNLVITVNDLQNGRRIECKDILEMLGVQEQLRTAATTFKLLLNAAANFTGEEVVEL